MSLNALCPFNNRQCDKSCLAYQENEDGSFGCKRLIHLQIIAEELFKIRYALPNIG